MVEDYRHEIHCCVVRFAALFSDWCEYEPLFHFLETWLSPSRRRRILAGRGWSAIPFLHITDATMFVRTLLARLRSLESGTILQASPDGAVSHHDLFTAATAACYGQRFSPLLLPKALCRPGLLALDTASRMTGLIQPFERPWMSRMIDRQLTVDASETRRTLDWAPRERMSVTRRMPFLLENRKTFPCEWRFRNHAAIKRRRLPENMRIHQLLEQYEDEICSAFTEYLLDPDRWRRFRHYHRYTQREHDCRHRLLLQALMNAVRTGEKGFFMCACRDLAEHRMEQGFSLQEVCEALEALYEICLFLLLEGEPDDSQRAALDDHIGMTIQFGIDAAHEVFEEMGTGQVPSIARYTSDWAASPSDRAGRIGRRAARRGCLELTGRDGSR
jgi:hypothetical protein